MPRSNKTALSTCSKFLPTDFASFNSPMLLFVFTSLAADFLVGICRSPLEVVADLVEEAADFGID